MAESISEDPRRVFLMRHADVRYVDADGRPIAAEGVGLTAEGVRQAEAAREALAAVALDRIVCSGLRRTRESAAIVGAGRGLERCVSTILRQPLLAFSEPSRGPWPGRAA